MTSARRAGVPALLLLPGALTVYTAFNGGGFFAGTQGWLAVVLSLLLVLRATLAEDPFAGASRALAVAGGAMALLCGWILLSAGWSDAPARALLDFDRALLYLLALVLFGTLPMTAGRLRVMLGGFALASVVVGTIAFITRALPEVWPTAPNVGPERLAYPITYWNALGLLAALGVVLLAHFTCSERERPWVRVAAAAPVPVLCSTLYFTLSRASIGLGAIALVAYLVLGRPRAWLGGLAAIVPTAVVATVASYHADVLASEHPTTPTGVEQGQDLALVVGASVVAAVVVRVALLRLDVGLAARWRLRVPRRLLVGVAAAAAAMFLGGLTAAGAPGYVERQFETFVERREPDSGARRSRLTDPSSNGRIDEWSAVLEGFEESRLHGAGAGTFSNLWYRHRPGDWTVVDAHSLYVETLGEQGVVGLALALVAVLALVLAAAVRIRGPDRALHAVAFCGLALWALTAGLDWHWEMPVVTLFAFCVGGAVLATPVWRGGARGGGDAAAPSWHPPRLARVVIGLGCLFVALTPWRVAQSQAHLNSAREAYHRGDCPGAIDEALDSLDAIGARPQPRVVLTYCDLRLGRRRLALHQIRQAVRHDPDDWELRYILAVVLAHHGRDPRPELGRARALNPREPLVKGGLERFASAPGPAQWRRAAARAPLPGL